MRTKPSALRLSTTQARRGFYSRWHKSLRPAAAFLALSAFACSTSVALADEGGVGFWFPGLFGSLSAVPQVPGWALGIVNLYNPVSGGGNVAAARQVTINNLPVNVNVNLNATIKANPNLVLVDPSYVFATPVFGGQLAASLAPTAAASRGLTAR